MLPKSLSDLIRGWNHTRVKPGCKLFWKNSLLNSLESITFMRFD
jgi:hypothetical protein